MIKFYLADGTSFLFSGACVTSLLSDIDGGNTLPGHIPHYLLDQYITLLELNIVNYKAEYSSQSTEEEEEYESSARFLLLILKAAKYDGSSVGWIRL